MPALDDGSGPRWRVIGRSVRGAAHVRAGLPNQDAIRWLPESGTGLPLILAVADGHGSARCFRSDVGSRLAVHTATEVVQESLENLPEAPSFSAVKRWAEDHLPHEIVRRWRDAVAGDLLAGPFTSAELERLAGQNADRRTTCRLDVEFDLATDNSPEIEDHRLAGLAQS